MKKTKKERSLFVKKIEYNKESWLTDFILGEKGSKFHWHMTLSGMNVYYLRDPNDEELINKF